MSQVILLPLEHKSELLERFNPNEDAVPTEIKEDNVIKTVFQIKKECPLCYKYKECVKCPVKIYNDPIFPVNSWVVNPQHHCHYILREVVLNKESYKDAITIALDYIEWELKNNSIARRHLTLINNYLRDKVVWVDTN